MRFIRSFKSPTESGDTGKSIRRLKPFSFGERIAAFQPGTDPAKRETSSNRFIDPGKPGGCPRRSPVCALFFITSRFFARSAEDTSAGHGGWAWRIDSRNPRLGGTPEISGRTKLDTIERTDPLVYRLNRCISERGGYRGCSSGSVPTEARAIHTRISVEDGYRYLPYG